MSKEAEERQLAIKRNRRNVLYFAADSMRGLFDVIDAWQQEHGKRLQSLSVQKDGNEYCCIALTNPAEVVIVDPEYNDYQGTVRENGAIAVHIRDGERGFERGVGVESGRLKVKND